MALRDWLTFRRHRAPAAPEQRSTTLRDPAEWFMAAMGAPQTWTGALVSEASSFNVVAVQCAVRVLAESLAGLPLILYRRTGGGKERATELPLYTLLHDQPNPYQTAFEFWEMMAAQVALWGNAGAEIERDGAGRPIGLWFVPWRRVRVDWVGAAKVYEVSLPSGGRVRLGDDRFLHVPDLSLDGLVGVSRIGQARQALGLTIAAEEYGAKFFGNAGHPGVVITHPGAPGLEAQRNIVADFNEKFLGLNNAHRTGLLAEGMKIERFDMPLKDAQFLELRKFQLGEVARMFRVPPHMLGDLDKATFSNIEQQSIDFVTHTVRPWARRFAQRVALHLVEPEDRRTLFAEHLLDDLLKGDTLSRMQSYAQGIQWGIITTNEARAAENRDPLAGGDQAFRPLNMVSIDTPPGAAPAGSSGGNR